MRAKLVAVLSDTCGYCHKFQRDVLSQPCMQGRFEIVNSASVCPRAPAALQSSAVPFLIYIVGDRVVETTVGYADAVTVCKKLDAYGGQ
jgi:hypothetical protein